MYHTESLKIKESLINSIDELVGGTVFKIGSISIDVEGKDGLGGLIEEWLGKWAENQKFIINNPKKNGSSQEFPDYYVGTDNHLLEVKTFDSTAGANFDLANFESYCESISNTPSRVDSDYLIFAYKLDGTELSIKNVWLKKIWEITCPSERWPLKTQTKRDVIYNIRPASWFSNKPRFKTFTTKEEFINALFETEKQYRGYSHKNTYLSNL
ncbi:restriction endonuclease [Methylococcaceae bacterium CS1]|nr:restriction endonuclease [Methylococcaceae bacterium CS5]TXL03266.1 restriction endonuclease [Methylococcaceae bacterium CS1]